MANLEDLEKFKDIELQSTEDGIFLENTKLDTKIFVTNSALKDNNTDTIMAQLSQGKDVEQITRITGYFSTVGNWNKGKLAELKDRYRVGKLFSDVS